MSSILDKQDNPYDNGYIAARRGREFMSAEFWNAFFIASGVTFWCMFAAFWLWQLIKLILDASDV